MRADQLEFDPGLSPRLTRDRIRVFVSSTIAECREERLKAKEAIESLNHEAFLFEAAGARPWPPRDVYLPRLYEADIFVGIYRHSYGWIAPDHNISGLEDEFRHATKRGIPCLVYLFADGAGRDDRLTALIQGIQVSATITYSHYTAPADLYDRIRDDVETVVASRFLRAAELEAATHRVPEDSTELTTHKSQQLVPRADKVRQIVGLLEAAQAVHVCGPPGSGKTTLMEEVAQQNGFHFISATRLSVLDILNAIGARLQGTEGVTPTYGASIAAATSIVRTAWERAGGFTLVIDDVQHSYAIAEVVRAVGGLRAEKRLLYTIRAGSVPPSHGRFEVPPFDHSETAELFHRAGRQLNAQRVEQLLALSGGNPLLLRYCAEQGGEDYEGTLAEFETARWNVLPPRAREVVSYVALTDTFLSLEDLLLLLEGGFVSPETIVPDIATGQWFLLEDRLGYAMRHEHQRETIIRLLRETPQRMAYYARRVADLMAERGDTIAAFQVLDRAADARAVEFGRPALFEAGRRGDFKRVAEIGQSLLSGAKSDVDVGDTIHLLLSVSEAEQYVGDAATAASLLREAEEMSAASGIEYLIRTVQEVKVSREASRSLDRRSLDDLERIRDEYRDSGNLWSYARLALEVTVLLIRMDEWNDAVAEGRRALAAFESLKDDYGADLARRNIASALSALPEREKEFSDLFHHIQRSEGPKPNERQRAWLCNVLVRRFRRAKRYERAKELAREAIRIGTQLGDVYLTAINTLNLGNVYRDEQQWDDALAQYHKAADLAHRIQHSDTEAKCARLASLVHLRKRETALAIHHALFAVGLVRGTGAIGELRDCLEQLGDAKISAHQDREASGAYLEAAIVGPPDADQSEKWRLAEQGLSILVAQRLRTEYLEWIDRLIGSSGTVPEVGGWRQTEMLFSRFAPILKDVDRDHCLGMVTLHCVLMFEGLPTPIAHFVFEQAVRAAMDAGGPIWRRLFPLLAILASLPEGAVALQDAVAFGETLTELVPELHYKSHGDGSPHWVFTLALRQPVICSISALDSDKETALVVCMLVLFLKGFEAEIQDWIIETATMGRREVRIWVANAQQMPEDMRSFVQPHLHGFCAVTRPTNPAEPDVVPTVVSFVPGITRLHGPGTMPGLQVLFGETLVEIAFQLFKGEIEVEVLTPKIVRLIRQVVTLSVPETHYAKRE